MDTDKTNQSMYEMTDQNQIEQQKEFNRNFSISDLIKEQKNASTIEEVNRESQDSSILSIEKASQLDSRDNTIDNFGNISVDIRQSQINNAITNKIQSKMAELKDKNIMNDSSMSQFRLTENDDRESYLDYTLDKSNLLVRKEIPSHETSRFNEIEENEQEKVDSKNNSNDMITDTMIYNSNKDEDSDDQEQEDDNEALDMNKLIVEDDDDHNIKYGEDPKYQNEDKSVIVHEELNQNYSKLVESEYEDEYLSQKSNRSEQGEK